MDNGLAHSEIEWFRVRGACRLFLFGVLRVGIYAAEALLEAPRR